MSHTRVASSSPHFGATRANVVPRSAIEVCDENLWISMRVISAMGATSVSLSISLSRPWSVIKLDDEKVTHFRMSCMFPS